MIGGTPAQLYVRFLLRLCSISPSGSYRGVGTIDDARLLSGIMSCSSLRHGRKPGPDRSLTALECRHLSDLYIVAQ